MMERINRLFSRPVLFQRGRLFNGGRGCPGWLNTFIGDIGGETLDDGEWRDSKSILYHSLYASFHEDAT